MISAGVSTPGQERALSEASKTAVISKPGQLKTQKQIVTEATAMAKRAGISKTEAITRISQVETTRAKEMERGRLKEQIAAKETQAKKVKLSKTTGDWERRQQVMKEIVKSGYKTGEELLAEEEKLEQRRQRQKEEDLGFTDTVGKYWDKLWGIPERPDKKVSPIRQMSLSGLVTASATGGASLLLPSVGPTVEDVYRPARKEEARGRQIDILSQPYIESERKLTKVMSEIRELREEEYELARDTRQQRATASFQREAAGIYYDAEIPATKRIEAKAKLETEKINTLNEKLSGQVQRGELSVEDARIQIDKRIDKANKYLESVDKQEQERIGFETSEKIGQLRKKYIKRQEAFGASRYLALSSSDKETFEKLEPYYRAEAEKVSQTRLEEQGFIEGGSQLRLAQSSFLLRDTPIIGVRPSIKKAEQYKLKVEELRGEGITTRKEKLKPLLEQKDKYGIRPSDITTQLYLADKKLGKQTEEEKELKWAERGKRVFSGTGGLAADPLKTVAMTAIGVAGGLVYGRLALAAIGTKTGLASGGAYWAATGTKMATAKYMTVKYGGMGLGTLYGYGVYKRVKSQPTVEAKWYQAGIETSATVGLFVGGYIGATKLGPALSRPEKGVLWGTPAQIQAQTLARGGAAFTKPGRTPTKAEQAQFKKFNELMKLQSQVKGKSMKDAKIQLEGASSKDIRTIEKYLIKHKSTVKGSSVFRKGADLDVSSGYSPKAEGYKFQKFMKAQGYKVVETQYFPEGGRLPTATSQSIVTIKSPTTGQSFRVQFSSPAYSKLSPFYRPHELTGKGYYVETPVSQFGRKLEGLYSGSRAKDVKDLILLTKYFKPSSATTQIKTLLTTGQPLQVQPPLNPFTFVAYGVTAVEQAGFFQNIHQKQIESFGKPKSTTITSTKYSLSPSFYRIATGKATSSYVFEPSPKYPSYTTAPRYSTPTGYRKYKPYPYSKTYTTPYKYTQPYKYSSKYSYQGYKYTPSKYPKYDYKYQYPKYDYKYQYSKYQYQYPKYDYKYGDYKYYTGDYPWYPWTPPPGIPLAGIPFGLDLKGKGKKARVGRKKYGYQFGFTSAVLGIKTRKAPSKTIFTGQEIRPIVI